MVVQNRLSGARPFRWVLWMLLVCFHATTCVPILDVKELFGDRDNATLPDLEDINTTLSCHFESCSEQCWKENRFDTKRFEAFMKGYGSFTNGNTPWNIPEWSSKGPYICHCDEMCIIYGDCCYDFFSECHGTNLSTLYSNVSDLKDVYAVTKSLTNDTTSFEAKMLIFMFRSCQRSDGFHDGTNGYWMISQCPHNTDSGVADKCTSEIITPLTNSPVTLKENPEVIFRNVYCGICHGFEVKYLLQWNTRAICPGASPDSYARLLDELKSGNCRIKSTPIEYKKVRRCHERGMDSCSQIEQYVDPNVLMCRSYVNMVNKAGVRYRNLHDILVHKKNLSEMDVTCPEIQSGQKIDHGYFGIANDASDGLIILFNFNKQGVQSGTNQIIIPPGDCMVDEVFDHYYDVCRKLLCQRGNVAVNGSCVFNGTNILSESRYFVPHHVIPDHFYLNFSINFGNDNMTRTRLMYSVNITFVEDFIKDLQFRVSNISTFPLFKGDNAADDIFYSPIDFVYEIMTHSDLTLTTLVHAISQINTFLQNESSAHPPTISDVFLSNGYMQNFTCIKGKAVILQNASLTTNNETMYAHDSDSLYLLERIGFVIQYNNTTATLAESMTCAIPLNCDFNILNRSEFELDNTKLKAIHTDQVLEEDSFFVQEERVYACNMFNHSRSKSNIQIFFKYDHIQGILTYVTSGVSIVSLLITLVVYSLLPELRNLPGRLTMSLSATLLVAQTLLLLVHLPRGLLCQALAITLHFSWLCSFMWMTVMSMSLAHTFQSKTKQALPQKANKTYALFSFFAFGIPAIIVGVSVLIDLFDVPSLDIGYGASGVCWIANPTASLLVFGFPVGLCIAANTISFVVTYYNINKSLRLSKNVASTGKDKSQFLIYSKLFIIMGLTWGFSFIAGFANETSLWYIFIILNGLQGFYILCSFICTDRVVIMVRKKLTGMESRHDVTSTVYTTAS